MEEDQCSYMESNPPSCASCKSFEEKKLNQSPQQLTYKKIASKNIFKNVRGSNRESQIKKDLIQRELTRRGSIVKVKQPESILKQAQDKTDPPKSQQKSIQFFQKMKTQKQRASKQISNNILKVVSNEQIDNQLANRDQQSLNFSLHQMLKTLVDKDKKNEEERQLQQKNKGSVIYEEMQFFFGFDKMYEFKIYKPNLNFKVILQSYLSYWNKKQAKMVFESQKSNVNNGNFIASRRIINMKDIGVNIKGQRESLKRAANQRPSQGSLTNLRQSLKSLKLQNKIIVQDEDDDEIDEIKSGQDPLSIDINLQEQDKDKKIKGKN